MKSAKVCSLIYSRVDIDSLISLPTSLISSNPHSMMTRGSKNVIRENKVKTVFKTNLAAEITQPTPIPGILLFLFAWFGVCVMPSSQEPPGGCQRSGHQGKH